jgi:outer membrane protein TolC
MIIRYSFILILILLQIFYPTQGKPQTYDLSQVLERATVNALELKEANSFLRESQLKIALLEESLKPQISLNATLPNLSRSIESRPLPDGRDAFVNRSTMYNRVGVQMRYQLAGTGGEIYAHSNLERLDILKSAQLEASRNYFYTPIAVGITQPLFRFNAIKWQKEQNQLLNKELSAQQSSIREEVIQKALQKYKTAFIAQLQVELAAQKVIETDSLLNIKQRLFNIGKATKIEILRLNLEKEKNQQKLEKTQLDWDNFKMDLCDYLSLEYQFLEKLAPPPDFQRVKIDLEAALDLALKNAFVNAQANRKRREAETAVEKAAKDNGLLFDLNASIGFNNSTDQLNQIFTNIKDRQTISLGITLPLTDKKSNSLRQEVAQESLLRTQIAWEQERIDLARSIRIAVKSYELLNKNIHLNKKVMDSAQEIYQLTSEQYLSGNQTFSDLNIASRERDQALLQYYEAVLEATLKYYEIRKICLYDFVEGKGLWKE